MFFLVLIAALATSGCGKDKKKVQGPSTGDVSSGGKKGTGGGKVSDTGGQGTPDPSALKNVIYFEFDSSELSDDSREILNNNATWLKEDAARRLTIEGHTDEVGTPEYNLGLGERRAQSSRDYLIRLGIEAARVQIITYGEEKPAGDEDSLNRRSMFIATKKN
jgi:peptidoglycan-associated lipoprotein